MWCPRGVGDDWAPYRDGYWRWFPSYGWTWVSSEPWGWTPYHYGRWAYVRDRWCWGPFINVTIGSDWRWRPHHVTFFGWGGDYNRGYRDGYYDGYWNGFRDGRYGWLGWCPLSPRDRRYGPKDHPRLEALGNFRARGGVSGMDARHFTGGRVHVARALLNAPTLHDARRGEKGFAAPAFVRNDDLKPLQRITPTRSDAVYHGRGARRFESPIVFRHPPGSTVTPGPRPNRDGRDGRQGPNRDERMRDGQRTSAPIGPGGDSNQSEPGRNPNSRGDRPWRMPDYKPPERGAAPPPRSGETRDSREPEESKERNEKRDRDSRERMNERAKDNGGGPARNEGPRRDERRSDDSPRRPDQPDRPNDRPNFERRETPRQGDDRREMRRPDPPSHDNSPREMRRPDPPPRAPERPSSPPPQSAPSRAPERPSSPPPAPARPSSPPPARESAPSRPAERPPERSGPRRPNL
jgi:hypothetical protein